MPDKDLDKQLARGEERLKKSRELLRHHRDTRTLDPKTAKLIERALEEKPKMTQDPKSTPQYKRDYAGWSEKSHGKQLKQLGKRGLIRKALRFLLTKGKAK